jgi:hypothetical protein
VSVPQHVAVFVDETTSAAAHAAVMKYARNLAGASVVVFRDIEKLRGAALSRGIDLILCWQLTGLRDRDALLAICASARIEVWAVAESCAALME